MKLEWPPALSKKGKVCNGHASVNSKNIFAVNKVLAKITMTSIGFAGTNFLLENKLLHQFCCGYHFAMLRVLFCYVAGTTIHKINRLPFAGHYYSQNQQFTFCGSQFYHKICMFAFCGSLFSVRQWNGEKTGTLKANTALNTTRYVRPHRTLS